MFPYHCEQQHFQLPNHMSMWHKLRFWDMQMSNIRFMFNPKKRKPNRTNTWLVLGNSVKSWERKAWLKSLQTSRRSVGTKTNVTPSGIGSVYILTMVCVHIGYKECVISYNRYEQSSKRNQLRAGIQSWAWKAAHRVKTAFVTSHWIQCKEIVSHFGTFAYSLSRWKLDQHHSRVCALSMDPEPGGDFFSLARLKEGQGVAWLWPKTLKAH